MFPQSFTKNAGFPYYTYDQRGLLRQWSPNDGTQALVDSLGMFTYYNSNNQIFDNNNVNTYQVFDDDESCFQTGNGAWILEYPHWDLVNDWQLPDTEALYNATYSSVSGLPRFSGRVYFTSVANTITSVVNQNNISQTVPFSPASVGDIVVVGFTTPNGTARLPLTGSTNQQPSINSFVYSSGIISIVLTNPNANSTMTMTSGITWNIMLIKSS